MYPIIGVGWAYLDCLLIAYRAPMIAPYATASGTTALATMASKSRSAFGQRLQRPKATMTMVYSLAYPRSLGSPSNAAACSASVRAGLPETKGNRRWARGNKQKKIGLSC